MREITNTTSILSGDLPQSEVNGLKVRPVSLSSMAMLELLNNSCLTQLNRRREGPLLEDGAEPAENPPEKMSMYALAEFVWIHAAPEEDVVRLVAGGGFDDAAAIRRAVLAFAGKVGFGALGEIVAGMTREMNAIMSAQAEGIKDPDGAPSKTSGAGRVGGIDYDHGPRDRLDGILYQAHAVENPAPIRPCVASPGRQCYPLGLCGPGKTTCHAFPDC